MRIAALALLAGCFTYDPGSFISPDTDRLWHGTHVALSCLDIAVSIQPDGRAPIVIYRFGNRCEHGVTVDLGAARVTAHARDRREVALTAYDPRHEIRPLALPPLTTGEEHIEYSRDIAVDDRADVCVDVTAVDRSGSAAAARVCSDDRTKEDL